MYTGHYNILRRYVDIQTETVSGATDGLLQKWVRVRAQERGGRTEGVFYRSDTDWHSDQLCGH